MTIFTLGFTQKSAMQFFEIIRENKIELLVDIRLNNKSQLAGFTKGTDLQYFLKEICNCKYIHCDEYAPTKDLLDRYHKGTTSWDEYVEEYTSMMTRRGGHLKFPDRFKDYERVCLLCSEPTPEKCHRRLLAEMISDNSKDPVKVVHL